MKKKKNRNIFLPEIHGPEGVVHLYGIRVHVGEGGAEHRHPMERDHTTKNKMY